MRNSSLTELDLRNNGISTTGGVALGEMLAKNTSLKRIDLRWNSLGASGGRASVTWSGCDKAARAWRLQLESESRARDHKEQRQPRHLDPGI